MKRALVLFLIGCGGGGGAAPDAAPGVAPDATPTTSVHRVTVTQPADGNPCRLAGWDALAGPLELDLATTPTATTVQLVGALGDFVHANVSTEPLAGQLAGGHLDATHPGTIPLQTGYCTYMLDAIVSASVDGAGAVTGTLALALASPGVDCGNYPTPAIGCRSISTLTPAP